jgi:serine/threonine protein kinase
LKIKSFYKPKISDFDLDVIIGVGNFGKVYKAFKKKEKRFCAIKVL